MINDFLKKYQEELISEKIQLKEEEIAKARESQTGFNAYRINKYMETNELL